MEPQTDYSPTLDEARQIYRDVTTIVVSLGERTPEAYALAWEYVADGAGLDVRVMRRAVMAQFSRAGIGKARGAKRANMTPQERQAAGDKAKLRPAWNLIQNNGGQIGIRDLMATINVGEQRARRLRAKCYKAIRAGITPRWAIDPQAPPNNPSQLTLGAVLAPSDPPAADWGERYTQAARRFDFLPGDAVLAVLCDMAPETFNAIRETLMVMGWKFDKLFGGDVVQVLDRPPQRAPAMTATERRIQELQAALDALRRNPPTTGRGMRDE